jgi:hypothetical protein
MKKWPWNKILVCVGWLLVVAGIAPGAYLLARLGGSHHAKPLSVPVSLKRGTFTSPYFTPDSSGKYLVELNWNSFPARQTDVELDWKIESDNGSVIQQGAFSGILRGSNTVTLGEYQPAQRQRQRITLNIHQDVAGTSADTMVEIGPPDATASLSYAIPMVAGWAAFVAIPGAILLLVLLVVGSLRQRKSAVTA